MRHNIGGSSEIESPSVQGKMATERRSTSPDLVAAATDPVMEQLGKVLECLAPEAPFTAPLKPTTFDGEDAAELFIQQFQDVIAENECNGWTQIAKSSDRTVRSEGWSGWLDGKSEQSEGMSD